MVGAWILTYLADLPVIYEYVLGPRTAQITPLKLVVSALIFIFALMDIAPAAGRIGFDRKWLPLGGLLSGLFGGLSGHQGALRSAFLIKAGLSKEAFIGIQMAQFQPGGYHPIGEDFRVMAYQAIVD